MILSFGSILVQSFSLNYKFSLNYVSRVKEGTDLSTCFRKDPSTE